MKNINELKTEFTFQDLLEAIDTYNNLPDLIYFERFSNSMAELCRSKGVSNEFNGLLWNRPQYIRLDFINKYTHKNIALSIDHLKETITGLAAQWLFTHLHPEIIEESPASLSLNRNKKDINKTDFTEIEIVNGVAVRHPTEFKFTDHLRLIEKLNNDQTGNFYKCVCHNCEYLYCWNKDTIYKIAKKGTKWSIVDTEEVSLNILQTMATLCLKLSVLDPDKIFESDPDFYNQVYDMSEEERKRIQ